MIYQNPNYCMGNRSTWEKLQVALGILKNPWMLLLDKLGLVSSPKYITRKAPWRSSMRFYTRGKTTDINDAVVVMSGKEYTLELIGLNAELAKSDSPVILDCGGHIGTFAMFIKSVLPNAKIWSLEPVPANQDLFRKNMALNQLNDVILVPFALYGSSGRFYIDLGGKQFDAVNITTVKPTHSEYIQIEALTLQQVLQENNLQIIDLLKMDIEGAEYNIFEHSLDTLNNSVRKLIMEFHPAGDKQKRDYIVHRLCNQGQFELVYETKNIMGFRNKVI